MPNLLYVILDENGNIVDFYCNFDNLTYNKEEVIGKNWFDTFIDPVDKEKIWSVFTQILQGHDKEYETYKNDIVCKDGSHRLIDFYNRLVTKDGKKYTFSVGMEHFEADMRLLKELAKEFYQKSFLNA